MFLLLYYRGFIFVNNCCLLVDDAKFNIYIKPIYRQQLNTDIATFLIVCFYGFHHPHLAPPYQYFIHERIVYL